MHSLKSLIVLRQHTCLPSAEPAPFVGIGVPDRWQLLGRCVVDQAPRQVHSQDLMVLVNMAEMVVRHLERDHLLDLQKLVSLTTAV